MVIKKVCTDKLKGGDVFLTYLVSYPIFRFFMEFLRLDSSMIGGINANQTMMLVIAVASAGFLVWRHRDNLFKKPQEPAEEQPNDDTTVDN